MVRGIFSKPSDTATLIASEMGVPLWHKKDYPLTAAVAIRWGTVARGPVGIVFNKADAIRLSSNKRNCRYFLKRHEIPTPQFTEKLFPIVGRPLHHTGGKDFFYCETKREVDWARWRGAKYFCHYYPKQNEYRIHIGHGKVLVYSEKYGPKETAKNWNYDTGFRFQHFTNPVHWRPELVDMAKKAVQAVGLDFGAVDIMADPVDTYLPKAVICEINTAPALSPYGIKAYAKYFHHLLYNYSPYKF